MVDMESCRYINMEISRHADKHTFKARIGTQICINRDRHVQMRRHGDPEILETPTCLDA